MKAGFRVIDITPPIGVKKIGWLADLTGEKILGPLYAAVAVFDDGENQVGFVQLDTLSVRWTFCDALRRAVSEKFGFPGRNVMVSATHNHAGPAISGLWPVPRNEAYCATLLDKCVKAFGEALAERKEAELAFGFDFNFEVAHNRRTMMKDGSTRSQTMASKTKDFLCLEGPRDGQASLLAARDQATGKLLGALFNYACHPVHHGGTSEISAGFPGVFRDKLMAAGCPVVYLNGAYGNTIHVDFERGVSLTKEQCGESLAKTALATLEKLVFSAAWDLDARLETIQVPFREITDDEYHGRVRGAQRFRSAELYEGSIDRLMERIRKTGKNRPVDIQVLRVGEVYFAGFPGEYFVEHQLKLKTQVWPKTALAVGGANGMIGYVPTAEAFTSGGYETTLGPPSMMAPETGDITRDKAAELIRAMTR